MRDETMLAAAGWLVGIGSAPSRKARNAGSRTVAEKKNRPKGDQLMSRMIIAKSGALSAIVLMGLVGCASQRAVAGDHCFYKGSMFSDGAAACQSGTLHRCNDGDWKSLSTACSEGPVVASKSCQFGGIAYSSGSASCQSGTQLRCEDGTWRSLGIACSVGDSPIRIVPSGRTCMFGEATVASNSTICKAGTTFLCSDGEWVNLGTLCR